MTLIVDASVAMKWVVSEPGREQAAELLTAYEEDRLDLAAPRLIVHEVASALSKLCRRKKLTSKEADEAFRRFGQREPVLVDDSLLAEHALELSLRHHISYWDCLYLALAIESGADVVTADRRFYRSISQHYVFVRLLRP